MLGNRLETQNEVLVKIEQMPLVSKGSELLQLEILRFMHKDNRYYVLNEFLPLNKNKRKILNALNVLVKKGLVKKLKSIPNFYYLNNKNITYK